MESLIKKCKYFLFITYGAFYKWKVIVFTANFKRIRRKIQEVKLRQPGENKDLKSLPERLFLLSTYRVNSDLRQRIFDLTIKRTLKHLLNSGLQLQVIDASVAKYIEANHSVLKEISGINLDYTASEMKFQNALLSMHGKSDKPYFCMIYDDQPILGLTPEFLSASCDFLDDFAGLVDLVLIEPPLKYDIDHKTKKVAIDMESLVFKVRKQKPLGMVKYNEHSFAIIYNYNYGFFFNTLIASSKDYARRLKWYVQHVKNDNAQYIELAGMKRRGPIYDVIAVSLDVCMLNMDCSPTELAIRETPESARELFAAFNDNYEFCRTKK